jgi:hypothetical protein
VDAEYRCSDVVPLFRYDALESLQGLEFYLRTIEEFIESERSKEVRDLQRHADWLPADKVGEYWAWHYPVQWDEIFASQLRSSFVVTLVSLIESQVGMVAQQACEIAATPLKRGDLRGGLLERHRKCLESLAGFARPEESKWSAVYEVRDVRNCIVHANSRLWDARNPARLRTLASKLPGLSAPSDVLELSEEFPAHVIATSKEFINALYDEVEALCERTITRRRKGSRGPNPSLERTRQARRSVHSR